jgi:leucyl/phenylalanyl-tRNA---protein transferase
MRRSRIYLLGDDLVFPDARFADAHGLLAIGGDLKYERLILAYKNGIFPWYSEGDPILWFSPDPRLVFYLDKLKVSRGLKKIIKRKTFNVLFDTDFENVIINCARVGRKNQDSTWITEDMIEAYIKLYNKGIAHSVETYFEGNLVGGLYGVSLGGVFFGESMFHKMTDASKVAFYYLVQKLKEWDFDFIDSQVTTEHMKSLGAEEISREKYLRLLKISLLKETRESNWS